MAVSEIVSLGQLVADVVVRPVEKLPRPGTADIVERIELRPGGCSLNTSIILKKLGLQVGIMGKVGQDVFGDFLIGQIQRFGLSAQGTKRDPDTRTTSAIVVVSVSGERSFLYAPGASVGLTLEDLDFEMIGQAEFLHIGGVMKLSGLRTAEVLKRAKELGVATSLDTDWDTSGRWLELIEGALVHTDVFMASLEEARLISNKETPEEIGKFFLERGVGTFVLKMGSSGCYVRTSDDGLTLSAYRVDVVDTTGAGDAFAAGFLAGCCKGWDIEKAGKLANACGALCTTRIGTIDGIENMEKTLSFMEAAGAAE